MTGRWGHSFEEDHDGIEVYRPAGYDFPRARGRAGIELRADGTFVEWAVGPGDAPEPHEGRWDSDPSGTRLEVAAPGGDDQVLTILTASPDRLELRR
ncbi:hypothetical protein [Georgenia yuyongxinii]|uniref:hypothetical protein n=1 Tax=Georgenia yuyongxinii TaxID=2589797 RepID=UPI001C8F8871|nr:hypothetical protein [Georgenia yuyongxinii]